MKWIALVYGLMSLISFVMMGWDKRAARREKRRTPEKTLHIIELLGGFPGSFAGQHLFRHKRRKRRYQLVFWLIVVLHVAGWSVWLYLRMGAADTPAG
jgi:uncharacterized membrane protein YsdA (DUF1294 family)